MTRPRGDDGFTLVEVLTSLAVIGVVLTAVTTFFVRSMVTANFEGARQAAVQVAATSMEELRSIPTARVLDYLTANAGATEVAMGTVTYTRTWTVPAPSALISPTVRVTWTGRGCQSSICSYSATTLISIATTEPLFS